MIGLRVLPSGISGTLALMMWGARSKYSAATKRAGRSFAAASFCCELASSKKKHVQCCG